MPGIPAPARHVDYLKIPSSWWLNVILLQMLVVVPAAYAFAKYEFKGKNHVRQHLIALVVTTESHFTVYLMMSKWGNDKLLLCSIITIYNDINSLYLLTGQYFMRVE